MRRGALRRARRRRAAVAAAGVLITGAVLGCAPTGAGLLRGRAAAPAADPVTVLRQDVDRLRAEVLELRTLIDLAQRAGVEHADRAAAETRAEIEAVRRALEAAARHEVQRQVEVLDAQTRRIDVLDRRAAEHGQVLRRLELLLVGIESQLARVLEDTPGPSGGARAALAAKPVPAPPASGPAGGRPPAESPAPAVAPAETVAPSMPGPPARAPEPANEAATREGEAPPAPPVVSRAPGPAAPGGPPVEDPARAPKPVEPPRETKTPPAPPPDAGPRPAKAAPPARETKTAALERPAAESAARPPKARPAAQRGTARELFDRAMGSWTRGERGQAVLDFEELVRTFPSDPLVAAAQFRIGEGYYEVRDFERAVLGYRKAVELDPTGKDTPQALLRLGLAYRAQKREADARQAWSQLIRDFPDSDATEEARRALRTR